MQRAKTVDDYIAAHKEWQDGLVILRELLNTTELSETIKWGAPTYTINNKNVVAIGAFKSYFGIWFFNGALLKDKAKCLVNAQDGKTKALRQWRFNHPDDIDKTLVKAYVEEAIANQHAGKEIKSKPANTSYDMPDELQQVFSKDASLKAQFESLAPYKQKEYALHIGSAKREATRISRLEKAIPMIKEGIGLNDKYRNC